MQTFLIRLITFSLPIILFIPGTDSVISNALRKSKTIADGELAVWEDVFSGNINSDILVYGSSRAIMHFDPTILTDSLNASVYNLGIDGHNFFLQNFRNSAYLKYNTKPSVIIYSIDVFTLQQRTDFYNPDQIIPYIYYNDDVNKVVSKYTGYKSVDYALPTVRFYGKSSLLFYTLKSISRNAFEEPIRYKGYIGRDKPWDSTLLEKEKKKADFITIPLDAESVKGFEEFIRSCKRLNIALVFVYAPEYIDGQRFISNRAEIINIFKRLSNKYSIPFYDYSDHPISYNKQYFYNALHMNKTGAELFSSDIANKLKKSGLF